MPPLLDPETLASLSEIAEQSGTAFLERLLRLFREHAPMALDALKAAREADDAPAAARAAHSLKSMSVNVGAKALGALLTGIERGARIDGACPDTDALARLSALLAQTTTSLENHFEDRLAA